jgi:hypothetical protein
MHSCDALISQLQLAVRRAARREQAAVVALPPLALPPLAAHLLLGVMAPCMESCVTMNNPELRYSRDANVKRPSSTWGSVRGAERS